MLTPNLPPSAHYTIYNYRGNLYKIVKHKFSKKGSVYHVRNRRPNSTKFSTSISRARSSCLDILLSNDWSYFLTCTLSPKKGDRFDLDSFHKKLAQFIRNQSKKYNQKFEYLLIPEPHQDGAYHFHGVLNCPLSALSRFDGNVPLKLKTGDFWNWTDYQNSFGFCSLSPIRDSYACALYVLKYITKNTQYRKEDFGQHLFYASQGLKRKRFIGFAYGEQPILDKYITYDTKYCATGIAELPFGVIENEKSPLLADCTYIDGLACIS